MDEAVYTKSKQQYPVRVNSLKRLEGSRKPHILSQTTASRPAKSHVPKNC